MENPLTDKIALVSGGSRGIGRAIALALAWAGADVAVNYRANENGAREACDEIRRLGRRAMAVRADVSRAAEAARLMDRVRRELGPVAILVNNAGIGTVRTMDTITEEDWDDTLAINLKAAYLLIQAALPDMRKARWGRIVSLSSVAAQIGGLIGPHYAASKGGIIGLTHYYAAHLAGEGITVNTIAPGPVDTDMMAGLPEMRPEMLPVGRFGTVDEIADVAVMLARNGYITGQTINVNGGRYFG
ncbi:MAG: 3-oxoacyl-ACP reductase FabG [bacterium]|nr:3-oxoacyl-ACP reductase FabG [bacterium]